MVVPLLVYHSSAVELPHKPYLGKESIVVAFSAGTGSSGMLSSKLLYWYRVVRCTLAVADGGVVVNTVECEYVKQRSFSFSILTHEHLVTGKSSYCTNLEILCL